ncbi:MAG: four helix bundle protein [Kiritimatiellia bacterium]|nr:four helix bundle protein [Kiritimatiellia bacterium]
MQRQRLSPKNEIALGECAETLYWLELLQATGYIADEQSTSIFEDCEELIKLFTSIVKTLKTKNESIPTQVREGVPDEAPSFS